jgi:hypothetical protein
MDPMLGKVEVSSTQAGEVLRSLRADSVRDRLGTGGGPAVEDAESGRATAAAHEARERVHGRPRVASDPVSAASPRGKNNAGVEGPLDTGGEPRNASRPAIPEACSALSPARLAAVAEPS